MPLVGIGAGSVDVIYVCNGCGAQIHYTGCDITRSLGAIASLGGSITVAFGCLFSTYYKTMKLALGINCYQYRTYNMLKLLHPVIKTMLDEMCKGRNEKHA